MPFRLPTLVLILLVASARQVAPAPALEPSPAALGQTLAAAAANPRAGDLILRVKGLRSEQGTLRAALFQHPEGFPGRTEDVEIKQIVPVQGRETVVVFTALPPGDYAASLMHDENANHRMDTNWFGMPVEGVGVSNDPQGGFGPPRFEDGRFTHAAEDQTLDITMRYLF